MPTTFFITGTDTNAGKTYVSTRILHAFNALGYSTIGIKPLASGCVLRNNLYYSDDALQLQQASSIPLDYHLINPIALPEPTAPHIAANQRGETLSVRALSEKMQAALNYSADVRLIEGIGGWLVPLNTNETMADFVRHHQFPVLLVVGIRLGCINHALLTYQSLLHDRVPIAGWIANCIDPTMLWMDKTIDDLKQRLPMDHLGTVTFNDTQNTFISIARLLYRSLT